MSNKLKISVLDSMSMGEDTPLNRLSEIGEVTIYNTTADDERLEHIGDSDIIVLNKIKITEDLIKDSKNLKLICVFATGFDNIDVKAAKRYGVAVCNVPGYSTDSVALYTVATVLSLVTKLREYNDYVRYGEYSKSGIANKLTPVYHEIKDKTWGIIGCGNIGSAVAKVAMAFGARVIVNKRKATDEFNCVDIETLCRESDIITVHCPLNEQTRSLIDKNKISIMKNDVTIVNAARGAVLNEADVADAIINGQIGALGCDVYSTEPFSEAHPYYKIKDFSNVLLTPHAAWGAYEARVRCLEIICDNIKAFLNEKQQNRVDC